MNLPTICIVSPCYNEEEILDSSINVIVKKISSLKDQKLISGESYISIIDDGSYDNSWEVINSLKKTSPIKIKAIKFSRNFGHQQAILAGIEMNYENADAIITIDVDLQDDIDVIDDMIKSYLDGFQLVFGVRKSRKSDTFFKRFSAQFFYKLIKTLGVNIIYNHADYRLSGKKVNEYLTKHEEVNLFLRGIFPELGFKQKVVYYSRLEREAGKTKFSIRKMLSFAFEGITSFSIRPLRIVTILGAIISTICIILSVYAVVGYFMYGAVKGWLSTVLPFYFIGGVQIFCIGIIGEYIGKIYKEVKQRPRYIVEEVE